MKPLQALSGGAWDCHAHVFGPYSRYPLAADRSYTPPEACLEAYLAVLARTGMGHGVLVHPSAYGDDHRLLLDTLAVVPQLRGVLVARPGTLPSLNGLRERGIRALRYSHRSGPGAQFAGSASFDDLQQMAPALAEAGLHAELWTDCQALPGIAGVLRQLPVPVVLDHTGGFDVEAGVGEPGFQALLSLLGEGRIWVKLCAYRNLLKLADSARGLPFHRAMLSTNPQQLLWGSDWPHLRVTPEPDPAQLLATFKQWTADDALVEQILQRNPQALYG